MKSKIILLVVGTILFTTSCKRVFTCGCKVGSITVSTDFEKMTRKEAKEKCNSGDSAYSECELQ